MGRNYFLSRHPMGWAKLATPHELGICYALPSLMTIFTHNLSHPLSDYFWWQILSILQNVLTKKIDDKILLFYKKSWKKLGINFFFFFFGFFPMENLGFHQNLWNSKFEIINLCGHPYQLGIFSSFYSS